MKKLINISLLSLLIIFIGCGKAESDSDTDNPKKKSSYLILNINGTEYGKYGEKDGVIFLSDGKETFAGIGFGQNGLHLFIINGNDLDSNFEIFMLYMEKANGVGQYTFDGLTISDYEGSGTNFTYRTEPGELNYFAYSTDEKLTRKRDENDACFAKPAGTYGKTEVSITKFVDPKDGHLLIEGTFTVKLYGKKAKDDCVSDETINLTGYFYSEN